MTPTQGVALIAVVIFGLIFLFVLIRYMGTVPLVGGRDD